MNNSILILVIFVILIFILTLINFDDFDFYYNDTKFFIQSDWKKNYLLNNNILDKPVEKVNKCAIVTFENRKDEYVNLHNQNVINYCKKWNYEYLFYDKCIHNVYWCKIYLVLDALKSGKYDYVLWMDSDSIIKNPTISLDAIVNRYSSDIFVNLDNGNSVYCSGVFIIKNSPIGISYLEDCIKLNNKNCLTNNNKLKGRWAGLCYEQGVMNKLIFEKYYKNTTCLPKYIVFNEGIDDSMKTCNKDTFILHLFGSPNNLREKCFSRFV